MKKIYRKDYQESAYLIKNTHLIFEIFEDYTIVKSNINFYQNPNNPQNNLILDGEDLELIDIKLDNKTPKYEFFENSLEIKNTSQEFNLQITTKIYPSPNTKLSGLYKSKSAFCTQCEAHGFRRITYFLDRPDVLSPYTVEIKTYKEFNAILSNGDVVEQNKKYAKWIDPYPKPCYLFALVVGDLVKNSTTYNNVELNIWCEKHNIHKTDFALESLKNAMIWDKRRFNLSYDLSVYNIVAVDDFNMGAMENKGLNIFNSKFVLADEKTATDEEYLDIETVIGHEYFHNWTGNRITCKSWFELSLKEGLTVFRDQEFSSDLRFREFKRISDVNYLRTYQFAEDKSSLSHPVRPESYVVMDNFYTLTVYEKGAEIVRMLHTILGEEEFQKGFAKYIHKYDGRAITIDDFVKTIIGKNNINFEKFMLWYSTKGVHQVEIDYNNNQIIQQYERITPIQYAIFNEGGKRIKYDLLILDKEKTPFDFTQYKNCTFSWNRNFSAPIELKNPITNQEKIFLAVYDDNIFVRFDNMQELYSDYITDKNNDFTGALTQIVATEEDVAMLSLLLTIPSEKDIYNKVDSIDVKQIFLAREKLIKTIAKNFKGYFLDKYLTLKSDNYIFNNEEIVKRKFKNQCLAFLSYENEVELVMTQYYDADNMTDKFAAFKNIFNLPNQDHIVDYVIEHFYDEYKDDELVVNKWFSAIATSPKTTHKDIKTLLNTQAFDIKNPNKVRSLIGGFASNSIQFHRYEGYEILTNVILQLGDINPQIGARLVSNFANYKKFAPQYQNLQLEFLYNIKHHPNLADDIKEMVDTIIK